MKTLPVVPDDKACAKAWEQIADIATRHALIIQAYGGVMTLAMPEEQRKARIRRHTLGAVEMREHPGEPCFCSGETVLGLEETGHPHAAGSPRCVAWPQTSTSPEST